MASVPATIVLAASALETPRERNATVTDFFDPGDPAGVKRNIFSSPVPRESVAASLGSATEGVKPSVPGAAVDRVTGGFFFGLGCASAADRASGSVATRSEERRVGKEGVRTCRSRWATYT